MENAGANVRGNDKFVGGGQLCTQLDAKLGAIQLGATLSGATLGAMWVANGNSAGGVAGAT